MKTVHLQAVYLSVILAIIFHKYDEISQPLFIVALIAAINAVYSAIREARAK